MTYDPYAGSKLRVQLSTSDGWKELKVAYFDIVHSYNPEDGVLIVDTESASMGWDYESLSAYQPCEAGDKVRMRYDGHTYFEGQVDSTSTRATAQSGDVGKFLYTFSCTLVGKYAAALIKTVNVSVNPADSTPTDAEALVEARAELLQYVQIVDGA